MRSAAAALLLLLVPVACAEADARDLRARVGEWTIEPGSFSVDGTLEWSGAALDESGEVVSHLEIRESRRRPFPRFPVLGRRQIEAGGERVECRVISAGPIGQRFDPLEGLRINRIHAIEAGGYRFESSTRRLVGGVTAADQYCQHQRNGDPQGGDYHRIPKNQFFA